MTKKRRVYISRVVGDQVMTSADLERLHKELLEYERLDFIQCQDLSGRSYENVGRSRVFRAYRIARQRSTPQIG